MADPFVVGLGLVMRLGSDPKAIAFNAMLALILCSAVTIQAQQFQDAQGQTFYQLQQPTLQQALPALQQPGVQPNPLNQNRPFTNQPYSNQPYPGQPTAQPGFVPSTVPGQSFQTQPVQSQVFQTPGVQGGGASFFNGPAQQVFAPQAGAVQQPGFQPGLALPNQQLFQNPQGFPQALPQQGGAIPADLDIFLSRLPQTGSFRIGGNYNSDSRVTGSVILEENNFDIRAFPRSFNDIGRAWRGNGETFRLELVPGNDVERYLVSWGVPYLFESPVSFNSSVYFFDRKFLDWDEERIGGQFGFGLRLSEFLSVHSSLRLENVEVSNPRVATSPQLNEVVGDTDLYVASFGLTYDTRRRPYLPDGGDYFSAVFKQAFGEFDYSRGELEYRRHRLIYQRYDDSGKHLLSFRSRLGFSGSQTPVFENFFAGGLTTLRGFDFRGVSPIEGGVRVGGEFQWVNSIEYTFPLTSDDMIHGVLFTDFGTVEEDIELNSENFRVAPGVGLRVYVPALGIGAPLALDWAFPVSDASGDVGQTFSFSFGLNR